MHFESSGEMEFSDEDVDRAIEVHAKKKPSLDLPWPEMSEHMADLRVCEVMGKGASKLDARALDIIEFWEMLMLRSAQIEAEPAMQENAQAKAEAKRKEQEQAKER